MKKYLIGFLVGAATVAGIAFAQNPFNAAIQADVLQQDGRNRSVAQRLDSLEKRVGSLEKNYANQARQVR